MGTAKKKWGLRMIISLCRYENRKKGSSGKYTIANKTANKKRKNSLKQEGKELVINPFYFHAFITEGLTMRELYRTLIFIPTCMGEMSMRIPNPVLKSFYPYMHG